MDLINPVSFEYAKAMVAKGGFDWALNFKWEYFDWSYFDVEENNVKLFKSPAMSGGLLAVSTDTFRRMGEYDMGMEIWGAENIELSLRVGKANKKRKQADHCRCGYAAARWWLLRAVVSDTCSVHAVPTSESRALIPACTTLCALPRSGSGTSR